ncbi:FecR family protein [Pedobacter chitinilyticus]|uniref:DUF4974 domain-containing protein n=1 Tax=Pedobacter chitinilyticus TaxID=2233776 RepID=A0A3S3R958_9SPHI|nr:FecR domain-containing protein [Pedobacter chitinilyticus]RWU10806.1 DUF4974 domain-containing protein [Pedobacter chitinilyticus]
MEDQIWNSIIKRLTGVETPASKQHLDQWLKTSEENVKLYRETEQLWALTGMLPTNNKPSVEPILLNPALEKSKGWSLKGIKRYSIAASLALVTSLTLYYLTKSKQQVASSEVSVYSIHKASNGKMLKVVLPDSSIVWLNAGSEVSYLKDFRSQKTRNIRLTGEAFFEVTHHQQQPFVVESGDLRTIVYGTSFNVSSYKDSEQNSVTVKTGKVGVVLKGDRLSKPTMLLPGNRLVYHPENGKIEKVNIETADVATWLNGNLVFDQTAPQEVFAILARKFDVDFKFNEVDFEGCKLTAKFPNQSLKTILTALSTSLHLKINEHGRTIYIKGGQSCK